MKGLLVGFGSIGRRHLSNFHGLGVHDWSVVRTGLGTLPFEPPCPVTTYTDVSAALERERPDFTVVANPTSRHVATALACLEAGSSVLLEKPVSDSQDRLAELAEAALERGSRVLVGFQFRYHPALRTIKEVIDADTLGPVRHVRAVWGEYLPDWHPWEDYRRSYAARRELGGGVHHTICHPFDYLRMLLGDAVGVQASLTRDGPLGLEVAEGADVTLRFAHGVVATIHLDYWSRPPMHRLEIVFAEGTVHWDHLAGELRIWSTATQAWSAQAVPGLLERNDLFVAQAVHFLDLLRDETIPPACSLADGIEVVRMCAAIEAADAG